MADREPDDIREALLSSIQEVEERTPGSTGGLADVAPKQSTTGAEDAKSEADPADPRKTASGAAPGRDETGKFLPKDKTAEPAKATATTEATKGQESPKPGAVEAAKPTDAAPGSLPQAIQAEWAALSPSMKAFVAQREKDMGLAGGKAGAELRQLKSQYEPIEALIGPRRAAVVAQNGSVENWLDQILKYSDFAGADPEGFIAWYLSQPNIGSRVDMNKLLGGGQPGQAQGGAALATDPVVQKLTQTISGLERRLQTFEGNTQQQQTMTLASELDAFEGEQDASGSPKHPHFATLRDQSILLPEMHMVRQLHPEYSTRQVIAEAYENAVWKHSDTRNSLLAQQQAKSQEEAEAKARAEAASRARKFVTGQPPSAALANGGGPKDDLKAEIAANYAAAMEGTTRRL